MWKHHIRSRYLQDQHHHHYPQRQFNISRTQHRETQETSCSIIIRIIMNYGIIITDEDEFIDALFVRLSCPGNPANEVVKLTMDAEVLCLSCADGLWHELKSVFKTDHLSYATKHLLAIIHRLGWSMVNLDWEDNLLVLIRDRATAERCEYWQFFDDPRALYLGSTTSQSATHLAVSRDASSYTYPHLWSPAMLY